MDAIDAQIQTDSNSERVRFKVTTEVGTYLPDDAITSMNQPSTAPSNRKKWWALVILNIIFVLFGQAVAVLLGKYYFDYGGHSIWMGALVQAAAFPILFIPLLFSPSPKNLPNNNTNQPSLFTFIFIYVSLGCLLAIDNFLYSVGLKYLPVSTYSLISASQLVFNAIFSLLINSEKLTILILNSIILIIMSASLVTIQPDSSINGGGDKSSGSGKKEHVNGFIYTLAASAAYSLLLSLTQFSFQNVLKKMTFGIVFELQIYTSFVSTIVCMVGLFASSESESLKTEMETFRHGRLFYVLSLVGTALGWQIYNVGIVGLIFLVSSLYSNVVSMLSLPFVPVVGALFFHETMDGVKVVAMLLTIWGFASYLYQQYLDDKKPKEKENDIITGTEDSNLDAVI